MRWNVQLIQLVYIHCIRIIFFYRYKNLDLTPLVKTQRQRIGSFCIPLSRSTSWYLVNLRNPILHFSMHWNQKTTRNRCMADNYVSPEGGGGGAVKYSDSECINRNCFPKSATAFPYTSAMLPISVSALYTRHSLFCGTIREATATLTANQGEQTIVIFL